ncbi:MAG TPA: hypothetical protein VJN67_01500 [Stellaceae bacterium]|nr:hypothetical protein [Stellaceae bacterium]
MGTRVSTRWWLIAAVASVSLATSAPGQTLLRSPQDIGRCLCQNRAVDELRAQMDRQFRVYEESRQRYAALEDQVDAVRARMNVQDREQIESFQRLLDQRDDARRQFQDGATPPYAAAVDRYNAAVDAYNGMCANTVFDPIALEQVQKALYCPR